ncbi:PD-(D/E)XK nuclease family transposase [Brevibacillus invocatus]|uniref:PD-(D/E)XK nuclease family transposase n=1 Tax=Brevibacillus invocatus TaxID=173959 RepID=UPI003B8A5CE4
MNRYMDLKVDFAFKLLFGTEGNEPILRALLNAILNRETAVAFFCPNSLNNPVKTR